MVCTTVTVVQIKPVITNLVATVSLTEQGWVNLTWTQDRAGDVTVTVDGVVASTAATSGITITGLSNGSHTFCAYAT